MMIIVVIIIIIILIIIAITISTELYPPCFEEVYVIFIILNTVLYNENLAFIFTSPTPTAKR